MKQPLETPVGPSKQAWQLKARHFPPLCKAQWPSPRARPRYCSQLLLPGHKRYIKSSRVGVGVSGCLGLSLGVRVSDLEVKTSLVVSGELMDKILHASRTLNSGIAWYVTGLRPSTVALAL